jgi:hypothetical protein
VSAGFTFALKSSVGLALLHADVEIIVGLGLLRAETNETGLPPCRLRRSLSLPG